MPNNSENVTTKFRVDVSDLKKNISDANKSIQRINAEFKNAVAGTDDWSKSADGLSAKIKQQSEIVEQEKKKLQALKDQLSRLNDSQKNGERIIADLTAKHKAAADAFGKDSDEAKALAKQLLDAQKAQERNTKAADDLRVKIINQDTAVKNAEGQVRKFSAALDDLQTEEIQVDDAMTNTTNGGIEAFAVALGNLAANVITKVVDGLSNIVTGAIEVGKQFEKSMSNVQAVSGATSDEMKMLEETARKFGSTTQFSASEAADALGYMALAGWDATESAKALGGILNLAAASGMGLADASDMVTDYLSAFGLTADKSAYFADMLAYAQGNANTTAEGLGDAFKNSAANMNAAGQDIETTISLLSMMSNQGLKGSQAGTALAAIMRDLTKSMENGAISIGETSVKIMDAQGDYRDLTSILKDVESATNKMGDAEKASALSSTFTADSIKGLNLVLNAGVSNAADFEKQLRNSGGSAEEMASIMTDNLEGDLMSLNSAYEEMGITLFQSVDAPLRGIVQLVTNDVIPAFTALINGTDGAGEKVGNAVGGLVTNVLTQITSALPNVAELAISLVSSIANGIVNSLPDVLTTVGDVAVMLAERLAEFIPEFANTIVNALPSIISAILTLAEKIVSALPKIAETIIKALPKLLQNISRLLITQTPKILQTVKTLFETIINALPTILNTIVDILPDLIAVFQTLVIELTPEIIDGVLMLLESIIAAYPQLAGTVYELIPKIADTLVTGLFDYVPVLILTFGKIFTSIAKSIPTISKTIWDSMVSVFDSWRKNIFDRAVTAFAEIAKTVKGWFSGLWEDIKRVFSGVGEFFGGIWNTIKEKFTTIGTKIGDAIGGAFKLAINAAIATVERAINGVPSAINAALDLINALPGVNIAKLPNIALPRLARGGVVNGATLAEIGEDGAEAVIPLEKNKKGLKQIAQAISGEMNGGTFGRNGNGGTHGGNVYNFNQTNNSPKSLSRFDIYRQTKNMIDLLKLQGV